MNKLIIPIIRILTLAAGIGALFIFQKPAFSEPKISHYNVFIVHFEPRSADERAFQRFKEWVSFAKEHNQKFSLGFTPQWVEMILKDPAKLSFVQELFKECWDMAPQHHGPHHGWDWDGYCDYGADRCMKLREKYYRGNPSPIMKWWYAEKEQYKGNMNDYMELMTKLYPFKVMAMGPDKFFDWPPEIQFSLDNAVFTFPSGIPLFDEPIGMRVEGTTGITHFVKKDFDGKTVYESGMRFLSDRNALEEAKRDYEILQKTGKENEFMAVVLHIEDDEAIFKDWIKYLYIQDPQGVYSKTITEMANQQLPNQISNNNVVPENKNTSNQNKIYNEHLSKDSIIVRKAIIAQRVPGQPYFTPYLKSYEDVIVNKGNNFAIEGFQCESCSSILALKLKLIGIKDNSIVVETQDTNWQNITKEIKSGDQIDPTPGMMDVVNYFEFQIGSKDGQLLLTYKSGGASIMPIPSN